MPTRRAAEASEGPPAHGTGLESLPVEVQRDPAFLRLLTRFCCRTELTPALGAVRVGSPWQSPESWQLRPVPGSAAGTLPALAAWVLSRLLGRDPVSGIPVHLLRQVGPVPAALVPGLRMVPAPLADAAPPAWPGWKYMLEQVLTGRWSAADLQRWCDDGSPPPLASSDGRWAAWDAATLGEWAAHDWPGAVEAVERATNPTPGGLDWTAWARLRREPDLRDDQRLDLWLVGQLPGYRPRCPGFAPSAEALTPGSWARLDGASFMAFLGSRFAALLGGLAPASELGRAVTRSHARQAILRSAGMSEGAPLIAPLLVASDQAICQAARERCGETLEAPAALLELARRILDPTPEDLLTPAELRAFRGLEALRGRGIPFDEVRAADLLRQHPALCAGLRWKAEGRRLELVVPTEGAARDLLSRPVDSVAEAILILSLVPGVATTHEAEAEASWQASLVALDGVVARAREEATRAAAVAAATEVAYINLLSTASRRRGTGLA